MKKYTPEIINLFFLALCAVVIVSCATQTPVPVDGTPVAEVDPVAPWLPTIKGAAQIATGASLQFGEKDAAKRTELANQIYSTAKASRTLMTGTVPTVAQVQETLIAWNTSTTLDAGYQNYVSAISAIYGTYYGQIKGNPKYAIEVLGALADGAEAGAKIYISLPTSTN